MRWSCVLGTLQPGDVFAGKYRIERVLGVGGMGVVYAAVHQYTRDRVALKFLLPTAAQSREVKTRFLNEARAAVAIKSEHVGRVLDVDVMPSGVPYMVLEFLEGHDLAGVIGTDGPLPVTVACDYVLQACEALAEAHALGIVHRDLKPSNLFLTRRRDGSALVKVLDFGISKGAPTQQASVHLTRTSSMLGSPLYMSPEQMTNPKGVDARTDVWALGVVLYELLSGTWPFESETVQGLAVEIVTGVPRPLRVVKPDVPEAVERVIATCLSKSPEGRFASVVELARALAPFASPTQASVTVTRVARVLGVGEAGVASVNAMALADTAVGDGPVSGRGRASMVDAPASSARWASTSAATSAPIGASTSGPLSATLAPAGLPRRGPWPIVAGVAGVAAAAALGSAVLQGVPLPSITASPPAARGPVSSWPPGAQPPSSGPASRRQRPDREQLQALLDRLDFNQAEASRQLGVPYATLDRWLRELGVVRPKDLSRDQIVVTLKAHGGDVGAAARALRVSPKGLRQRLNDIAIDKG